MHTLRDNGYGNKPGVPPAISYVTEFKEMRGILDRSMDESIVSRQSPSDLWDLQMNHAARTFPAPDGRLVVTDDLYPVMFSHSS